MKGDFQLEIKPLTFRRVWMWKRIMTIYQKTFKNVAGSKFSFKEVFLTYMHDELNTGCYMYLTETKIAAAPN